MTTSHFDRSYEVLAWCQDHAMPQELMDFMAFYMGLGVGVKIKREGEEALDRMAENARQLGLDY